MTCQRAGMRQTQPTTASKHARRNIPKAIVLVKQSTKYRIDDYTSEDINISDI